MTNRFLDGWCVASVLGLAAFGGCSGDDKTAADASIPVFDATPDADLSKPHPFCQEPIVGLDPACPEGGEVRIERLVDQEEYRFTAFLKSAQDDADTPPILPPGDVIGACFVCDPRTDMWGCRQVANRVYVPAGRLTIRDGTVGNDIEADLCTQGTFAMGEYQTDECATGAGATGIAVDAIGRAHPDGAYIGQDSFVGTAIENDDAVVEFSFAGDGDGYPASTFEVYIAPDFTATPNTTDPVAFNDNEDLVLSWDMPAANNLPIGTAIVMAATFMDGPPTLDEGPATTCLLGVTFQAGGAQSFTIPAATVATFPRDGVLVRSAATHVLSEYNDGMVRERRIDRFSANSYSQPFSKNLAN